MKVFPDTNRAY